MASIIKDQLFCDWLYAKLYALLNCKEDFKGILSSSIFENCNIPVFASLLRRITCEFVWFSSATSHDKTPFNKIQLAIPLFPEIYIFKVICFSKVSVFTNYILNFHFSSSKHKSYI